MRLSVRLCLAALAVYFAAAVFGEVQYRVAQIRDVTPEYNRVDTAARDLPPSAEHWLGTDNLGRSVALRLVQGTRIAFYVGVLTSLIAIPLGVAIALVVGKGLAGVIVGIGLTTWVGTCRTVRAETVRHRALPYVLAARTLGYSHFRIMFRHILPNVAHVALIQLSIRFPSAVATEVFISFLGIGVQGEPSWGVMINNARTRLWQGVWWEMAFTTLAIFVLVLAFNHLADFLRDRFDPALRSERA